MNPLFELGVKKEPLPVEFAGLAHHPDKGKLGEDTEREHSRRDTGAQHEGQQS